MQRKQTTSRGVAKTVLNIISIKNGFRSREERPRGEELCSDRRPKSGRSRVGRKYSGLEANSVAAVGIRSGDGRLGVRGKVGCDKPSADARIVTHCIGGGRAGKAQALLAKHGFENAVSYPGSFSDWVKNGGQVEKK